MAKLELTYHQAFPEEGDPGWHAGRMPDGRRVHTTRFPCNPRELHWAGSVEDPDRCECDQNDGTCNLCLIRENGGLVFTRVTGCYRSANSAVRALQQWAANPDAPLPPAPWHCTHVQRTSMIQVRSLTMWPQPASRRQPPRGSQHSSRRRDGRRSGKPGAKGCRFEGLSGNWESTGAPSGDTWMPRVLQRDNPGRLPRRHHLIPSQHNRVTFTLNT